MKGPVISRPRMMTEMTKRVRAFIVQESSTVIGSMTLMTFFSRNRSFYRLLPKCVSGVGHTPKAAAAI